MFGKESNRSGVALIIVLGLVAILMIISVAFAIHMRVERAGAANLRHAAVARQIVKGGMAAAIAAIDQDVKNRIVAPWYDTNDVENLIYTRREKWINEDGKAELRTSTLVAYDTNAHEHVTAHFSTEVDAYLPAGLKYRSFANRYCPPGNTSGGKAVIQPEWMPVYANLDNSSVIGRYSYFVLDTTGMLDANAEYGSVSPRAMGRETKEIQLLPGIRNLSGRYLSIADMDQASASDNTWWNTFSYEPTNKLVYIGGDADEIRKRKQEIIAAFYDCGLQAGKQFGAKDCEQARWAYLGLVDYVDEDYVMEEDDQIEPSQRPATERMPLVSGFLSELTIEVRRVVTTTSAGNTTADNVQVKFSAKVKVPFVFPFYDPATHEAFNSKDRTGVRLEGKARLSVRGGGQPSTKSVSELAKQELDLNGKDEDECIVSPIDVDRYEEAEGDKQGWVTVKKQGSLADTLKLPGIVATIRVAGATYRKENNREVLLHCFPVGEDGYKNKFDKVNSNIGLVVQFKPDKEGVEFHEDDDGIEKKQDTDESGNTTATWTWQPRKAVVWAEIVDPRFANKTMVSNSDFDEEIMRSCYKVSHGYEEAGNKPIEIHKKTLLQLGFADAVQFYNEYNNAADDNGREDVIGKWNNAPKDVTDITYGKYFRGRYTSHGTRVGSGPFASHLMADPDEAYLFYGMPMDGVQKGSDSAHTDKPKAKWDMFVRNEPLDSVGELGYLPIGFWQTIRLYDYGDDFGVPLGVEDQKDRRTVSDIYNFNKLPEDPLSRKYPPLHDNGGDYHEGGFFHAVFDQFSVVKEDKDSSGEADEPVKGRLDLNASSRDILASAFYKMPIGKPDGRVNKAVNILGEDDAYLIADAIIKSRNLDKDTYHRCGNFCSVSELGYIFEEPYNKNEMPPLYGGGNMRNCVKVIDGVAGNNTRWGEWERESIIRNSCGLFTTRGQSYLIIVRGESYSPRFGHKRSMIGGNSNASKTAIAQVWRDTIPDKNGKHPFFVKFFKIIDD